MRWISTATVAVAVLSVLNAQAASITNVASGLWTNDAIWSGGNTPTALDDVTITNDTTVTIDDMVSHAIRNLTVNGTLTHTANSDSPTYKVILTASGDVMVTPNGAINVDSKGYAARKGPGGGTAVKKGGTHGGRGYVNTNATYGSVVAPVSLGSGGHSQAGGGAIKIEAAGTITVDGSVNADGKSGEDSGAGGSIWIIADTLTGTGLISANGGNSGTYGTGGGGRISFNDVTNYTFSGTMEAKGGHGSGGAYMLHRGNAGTIVFSSAMMNNFTVADGMALRLGNDIEYTFGDLTIQSNGVLELDGDPYGNDGDGSGCIIHASNVNVQAGGSLSASYLGFAYRDGPGGSSVTYRGGTHGGRGHVNTNATYGSPAAPVSLGSGGPQQPGGGAIKIESTGTITVDGTVSADGKTGEDTGAGGSIWIVADTLTGSGLISANGGMSASYGAGGGGRISFNDVTNYNFTGAVEASGGHGGGPPVQWGYRGNAGTIIFSAAEMRAFTVTDGMTLRLGNDIEYAFGNLTIQNNGVLELDGDPLGNNGDGSGCIIHASNVNVQAGGSLSASKLGFIRRSGPGGITSVGTHGGTHGGQGGSNSKDPYGSVMAPVSLGSGGSNLPGGGAVKIVATGTVTVDGTVSARGYSLYNAGSGGSIWIVCDTLTGAGVITAQGGDAGTYAAGGGGRIKLECRDGSGDFTSKIACGGVAGKDGAAGTVVVRDTDIHAYGDLSVDNDNMVVTGTEATVIPTNNFTGTPPSLNVDDIVVSRQGHLVIPSNMTLVVNGHLTNTATLTCQTNSTVELGSTATANVIGDLTFYNLTSSQAGKTLYFESGATSTVNGTLTLDGVRMYPTVAESYWYLTANGSHEVRGVQVHYSDASGGDTIYARASLRKAWDNPNWVFISGGTMFLLK